MQFEEDFAGARRIDLNRSTKHILEAANGLIPLKVLLTRTPTTEAEYAAKTAQARIERDGGSVAVLYRTNAQGSSNPRGDEAELLPSKSVRARNTAVRVPTAPVTDKGGTAWGGKKRLVTGRNA
ncbi:MAG: hypothetical protein OXG04_26950 [Acidobacteria bacterium]|nr:hypothetical protein [Acidobacteriota bacterium]